VPRPRAPRHPHLHVPPPRLLPFLMACLTFIVAGHSPQSEAETLVDAAAEPFAYDPAIIDTWTLEEQVGQLLVWGSTQLPADVEVILAGSEAEGRPPIPIGGVLMTSKKDRKPTDVQAVAEFLRATELAPVPPLLCADQEGGKVAALREGVRVAPSHFALGGFGEADIRTAARDMAEDTRAAGIDVILGPVLDVDGEPFNPAIGAKERSFSSDPLVVAQAGLAFTQGLLDGGIIPVLKHFPGHGTPQDDSHLGLPAVEAPIEEWEATEQIPYRFVFEELPLRRATNPVVGVMIAHLDWPALTNDEGPTCFSPTLVKVHLRERYGLQDAVVVSDDLLMKAIKDPVEGAVQMRKAGIDLLLVSSQRSIIAAVHKALVKYYRNGWLNQRDLRASLERILRMKSAIANNWAPLGPDAEPPALPETLAPAPQPSLPPEGIF